MKMASKYLTGDVKAFVESVGKKPEKHNGKKIRFCFVKRKR